MALPPYVLFVRHLWLSFLVYTGANAFLFWALSAMPWGMEELGAGRALVFLIALCLWIVAFILAIGFWKWALVRNMSQGTSAIMSVIVWVLSLAYVGGVAFLLAPWKG